MKYNRLGRTDLHVSAVGLGGWALGGATDWGATEETDARRTIFAALDAGITLFDTAPIYGESEVFLGRALKGRRPQVVLATKCGLVKNGSWTDHDLRPQTILSQLEQSLSRLQTDYIDLYQIHYPDPRVPLEEALAVLIRLREQGKIRYIGFSFHDYLDAFMTILNGYDHWDFCQIQYNYVDIDHQAGTKAHKGRAVFSACEKLHLGFIGYGTLCGGILSGKYKKEPNLRRADARNYFYKCYRGDAFASVSQTVLRVKETAQKKGCSAASLAGAWALAHPQVSCVLTGARTAQQALQNAAAADIAVSPAELKFLEEGK